MTTKTLLMLAAGCSLTIPSLHAGQQVSADDKKTTVTEEKRTWFPDDPYLQLITVGGLFSEHLSGVTADNILGVYASQERDTFFFYDSRYHYEDNGQYVSSNGLAFRKLFSEQQAIVGLNAFWDRIDSQRDNNFDQLGLGAEVLTRWVDWRFNYYLPEDKQFEVDRFNRRDSATVAGPGFLLQRNHLRSYKTYEAVTEGFDTELGFLVPGVDKFMEVRVFGGYHHFNNPYGKDFEGFQARLEARLLRGVIADVAYSDDTHYLGGHWAAGVRVSVPFSILALAHGRNPFAGFSDEFKPGPRPFQERLGEEIIRSPRIETVTSGGVKVRETNETFVHAVGGPVPPPPAGVPFE